MISMNANEATLWQRIKARHLESNVYTLIAFVVLFLVSTALYVLVPDGVSGEIFIAVSTSLLATIFISFFDIYTGYKNFENKAFIENLYKFGIHNLHLDKADLLARLIHEAHDEIWISGYRLILTRELSLEIYEALRRGVRVRFLVCPPWETAHTLVYGDLESSLENYLALVRLLFVGGEGEGGTRASAPGAVVMRFTKKPLFNDTYLVDDKIVTSPFMHNKDLTHGVISAKDFFTYELDKEYRLYELVREEYLALWEGCSVSLEPEDAEKLIAEIDANELNLSYNKKVDIFKKYIYDDGTGESI